MPLSGNALLGFRFGRCRRPDTLADGRDGWNETEAAPSMGARDTSVRAREAAQACICRDRTSNWDPKGGA